MEQKNENQNPLKQFYRAPKLYVKLPSRGKFNEVVDTAVTGEIPVFAMTGKDEVIMRNPDALLNGDAVVQVVGSCAPNVKDPINLPVCDVDLLLIAIRMATYGEFMETKIKSPHSKKIETYSINLNNILEQVTEIPETNCVVLDNGCSVYVKPFNYSTQTKINLTAYDQAKAIKNLDDIDGAQAKQFKTMFVKLANLNVDVTVESIQKIVTPEGDAVVDSKHIKEFLENSTTHDTKKIDGKINELNTVGTNTKQTLICPETEKEFVTEVRLDPADFFVTS